MWINFEKITSYKLVFIIFLLIVFLGINFESFAKSEEKIFKTGISLSDRVPAEVFGVWKVKHRVIMSNNPFLINEEGTDTWEIRRYKNEIVIANSASNAVKSVLINDIKGKTIVFTHTSSDSGEKLLERPKITVNGDTFSGSDTKVIKTFKANKLVKTTVIIYEVKGERVFGSKAREF